MQAHTGEQGPEIIKPSPRTHVVHAWLTQHQYLQLVAAADRRRMHPDRLVADLTMKVMRHGIVDELLDLDNVGS